MNDGDEDETGLIFGDRWEVIELLGIGGCGRVWRVKDRVAGGEAALKLIKMHVTGHQARVQREIAALQTLRIPGVVQLLDLGHHHGEPYLVMELIHGRPFPGAPGRLTWSQLREPTLRLLDALARVHATGILHRDLKPANVMVDMHERVVILDFGLARGTPGERAVTRVGGVIGTPRYLAPEQLAGTAVDVRADLYAVGVMLFDALTGTSISESAVFARSPTAIGFPPLAHSAPDVPAGIAQVIDALLADAPSMRPATAAEVRRLLVSESESDDLGIALPLLAIEPLLADVCADVLARRDVDLDAPRGSGRTRFVRELAARLAAVGVTTLIAKGGRRPISSLRGAVGEAVFIAGPAATEDELRARLGRGEVLLVDGLDTLDAWSRRILERVAEVGTVVRVGVPGALRRLDPLRCEQLNDLFMGPDIFLHLREDAAALLHDRTDGVPVRFAREVDAWVAAGLAQVDQGLYVVTRDTLEQLTSVRVVTPEPALELDERVDPGLAEVLSWSTLAGEVYPAELAAAMERPEWEIEVSVDELQRVRLMTRGRGGTIRANAAPPSLHLWPEELIVHAHRRVAGAMGLGTEAQLMHLLAAGDVDEAIACAVECAQTVLTTGRSGHAFGVLNSVLSRVDGTGADVSPLIPEYARAALQEGSEQTRNLALHALERRTEPVVAPLVALLRAQLLAGEGRFVEARHEVRLLAPFSDSDLDSYRCGTLVRCAIRCGDESPDAVLDEVADRHAGDPVMERRIASWRGLLAYDRLDYAMSARFHTEAVALATNPGHRAIAIVNLLGTLLEQLAFAEMLPYCDELEELGRTLRLPRIEAGAVSLRTSARYRQGLPLGVGDEVVGASAAVREPVRHAGLCTTIAAQAWRDGDVVNARRLSRLAHEASEASGWLTARAFSAAFRVFVADPEANVEGALALACKTPVATVRAQALGMIGVLHPEIITPFRQELLATVDAMPAPATRREVLSPEEIRAMVTPP